MKTRIIQIVFVSALLVWVGGCAILQREGPEKKARELMVAFQQSLNKPDEEILKFFDTEQSHISLLGAIQILQNTDSAVVKCAVDFTNMAIEPVKFFDENAVAVKVSATFTAMTGEAPAQQAELTFYIAERNSAFKIVSLDGNNFYNAFTSMKHDIQYATHIEAEIKEREAIYEIARNLEEKFDTLVWYTQYNGKVYFYAVSGDWNEESLYPQSKVPRPDYKMGLIDETGKEIIPMAFKMIGTPGISLENAVEVETEYGYGYFSLDGDTLVSPDYTQIIPYPPEGWIVQSAGQYGFVDNQGKYTEGFINKEAETYVKEFAYLPSHVTISEAYYTLCESPRQEGAGSGLLISPSYWVAAGFFDRIEFGFTTTASNAPVGGWTEYIEVGETIFLNISEHVNVLATSFKERYLEGREEFYEHSELKFMDENQSTFFIEEVRAATIDIKKISDELMELSQTENRIYFEMSGMEGRILNPRMYRYYKIDGGNVNILDSKRGYPETEFVKLDDSYITGNFFIYSQEVGNSYPVSTLPVTTLKNMRYEILAEYGLKIKDEAALEWLQQDKYDPRYEREEELEEFLTDIDRHNLQFLAEAIRASGESL